MFCIRVMVLHTAPQNPAHADAAMLWVMQISTIGKAETAFNPGVKIPNVVAESAAARAGFQSGDLIVKVAGVDVPAAPNQVRHHNIVAKELHTCMPGPLHGTGAVPSCPLPGRKGLSETTPSQPTNLVYIYAGAFREGIQDIRR